MPANERYADLEFPSGGVNTLTELQQQPPGTCADALNVRNVNPDSLRQRGGSRAGLVRYLPDPLIVGGSTIQHLNVIVDPQADRLPINIPVPGDDWVEDPLFPGTFVPPGGWGIQPNPNATQPSSSNPIEFYQAYRSTVADLNAEQTYNFEFNFDLEVLVGHTIVVAILMQENTPGAVPSVENTVTNDAGDSYHLLNQGGGNGGYERFTSDSGSETTLSLWYKRVANADDEVLKINASAPGCFMNFRMVEYANVATTTPSGFSFNSTETPTQSLTTGQFTLGAAGQMAVAAFATDEETTTVGTNLTAPAGYANRLPTVNLQVGMFYLDDVDHGLEVNMEVAPTMDRNVRYAAVGAGFFRS